MLHVSNRSRQSSVKKPQEAAEIAATKATITTFQEIEHKKEELEALEDEKRQKLTIEEADDAPRRKAWKRNMCKLRS